MTSAESETLKEERGDKIWDEGEISSEWRKGLLIKMAKNEVLWCLSDQTPVELKLNRSAWRWI